MIEAVNRIYVAVETYNREVDAIVDDTRRAWSSCNSDSNGQDEVAI